MADLIIKTSPIPDGIRVSLIGDAGMADLGTLEEELARISAEGPAVAAFDLSRLSFISSAGMGAFLKLRASLAKKNGVVRLGGASPEIAEAFRRAKLDRLIELVDSV